ncbi:LysE family translocator [Aestuariibius sp. 2305UL40-4]|uniref:LysE family translocator n=1 Tax=Aestuariibius violaceus TaxID=3234132 RepID=UPI00345E6CD5
MIDPLSLLTYTAIVAGFVFIPGPATLLTMARATGSGTRAGIATAFGIAVGDVIHTILAVIGLSAIVFASAVAFTVVKYLGAAYLIYLGLKAIFASRPRSDRPVQVVTPRRAFRQAILAELLNPKTALFFVAFLPQFVVPENGAVMMQLAIFGAILIALGLLSTLIFAITAGHLSDWLRGNRTFQIWQGRVVGSIYCGLGLRLALQER